MPKPHDCHMEVGDRTEEQVDGAEGTEVQGTEGTEDEELTDAEKRHIGKMKMRLAVMGHKIGKPLDKDIYYGEKIVARAGQPITRVMVERLREMEPEKLHFTVGGMRRLNMD